MDGSLPSPKSTTVTGELETHLKEKFPQIATIHPEPVEES
jgi:hypothetical protein